MRTLRGAPEASPTVLRPRAGATDVLRPASSARQHLFTFFRTYVGESHGGAAKSREATTGRGGTLD